MSSETTATDAGKPGGFMRFAPHVARVLMGALFTFAGSNGLFHYMPDPDPKTMSPAVLKLMGAFMESGYMFPMIAGTQLLVGLLLLVNRFVPLAVVLLAPVVVNIVLLHAFLDR